MLVGTVLGRYLNSASVPNHIHQVILQTWFSTFALFKFLTDRRSLYLEMCGKYCSSRLQRSKLINSLFTAISKSNLTSGIKLEIKGKPGCTEVLMSRLNLPTGPNNILERRTVNGQSKLQLGILLKHSLIIFGLLPWLLPLTKIALRTGWK